MLLTSLQVSLAVSAWADLARRPAGEIKGRKGTWAAIIAINFIGPLLYFRRGRQGVKDRVERGVPYVRES